MFYKLFGPPCIRRALTTA